METIILDGHTFNINNFREGQLARKINNITSSNKLISTYRGASAYFTFDIVDLTYEDGQKLLELHKSNGFRMTRNGYEYLVVMPDEDFSLSSEEAEKSIASRQDELLKRKEIGTEDWIKLKIKK